MYSTIYELNNVFRNYASNRLQTVKITEFYPQIGLADVRIPVDEDDNAVHQCFAELCNRNINLINRQINLIKGPMKEVLTIEQYKAIFESFIGQIRVLCPYMNITHDDIDQMYRIWSQIVSHYNISGVVNTTSITDNISISDLKNAWVPEFDIGTSLSRRQFIEAIHRFIPEFSDSVLMNDALYAYAKMYIMSNNNNSIFNMQYTTDNIVNYVTSLLPNVKKEELLNIIESPLNISIIPQYYTNMMKTGCDYNAAKALLCYHSLVFNDTYNKVRKSFGIDTVQGSFRFTLPISMYLPTKELFGDKVAPII